MDSITFGQILAKVIVVLLLHRIQSATYALVLNKQLIKNVFCSFTENRGTGSRGLMRGMATLPQGNQELLVVRDKVGRPPGEFGVSKSMGCDICPSVL